MQSELEHAAHDINTHVMNTIFCYNSIRQKLRCPNVGTSSLMEQLLWRMDKNKVTQTFFVWENEKIKGR